MDRRECRGSRGRALSFYIESSDVACPRPGLPFTQSRLLRTPEQLNSQRRLLHALSPLVRFISSPSVAVIAIIRPVRSMSMTDCANGDLLLCLPLALAAMTAAIAIVWTGCVVGEWGAAQAGRCNMLGTSRVRNVRRK